MTFKLLLGCCVHVEQFRLEIQYLKASVVDILSKQYNKNVSYTISPLSLLVCFHKGLNTQLKGAEVVKKGVLQEEDPLLVDKSTLPVSELNNKRKIVKQEKHVFYFLPYPYYLLPP